MDYKLKEKKVFISGSSKGIGLSIALKFMNEGANVIINSRNSDDLIELTNKYKSLDYIEGDVSKTDDAVKIASFISQKFNQLDVLICNVGSGKSVPQGEENYEEWQKTFSKNFFSTTNIVEATKHLLEKSKGCIVCISSICALEHIPNAPVTYSVAKNAINSYVKFQSFPLSKKGIRINSVAPGNINFPGSTWEKKINENPLEVKKMIKENVPMQRLGSTDDIANLVLFLSSDLSNFTTGSIFTSDGGQTRSL
tara:strand:+ start:862 stop:1620 length:759 start_codon:yes stop_codon:yes gene_type:complete